MRPLFIDKQSREEFVYSGRLRQDDPAHGAGGYHAVITPTVFRIRSLAGLPLLDRERSSTVCYGFQIINVLLVTTISGSVVNSIEEILQEPASTFSLLGGSLPRVCAFFCCYVFMKAFAGLPLELCRGVAAAQQTLKRVIYPSATQQDRKHAFLGLRDIAGPGWFSFGKYGAQDLLVVVVMMVYVVMSPVVLVPGLLFFSIGSVVYRHQLLFVYEPLFESGGLLWPRFYRRILFSVFLTQFTMVGLFFSKKAYMQGYLTLALSAVTYLYQVRMKTLYTTSSSVAHHLPMELASRGDEEAILDEVDDLSRYVQHKAGRRRWRRSRRRWRSGRFVVLARCMWGRRR